MREAGGGIAEDAAAEQPEHLNSVLGSHEIRIADDEQGGCLYRLNDLGRHVLEIPIHLRLLDEKCGEIVRIGRYPSVFFVPRRPKHHFGFHVSQSLHKPGVDAAQLVRDRGEDELAYYIRMADG